MGGIFAVQDEISRSVVDALKVKLLPRQASASKEHHTENSEAYTHYLRGQHFSRHLSPDANPRAIEAYQKALALDPGYAPAWAGLAMALDQSPTYSVAAYFETEDRALAAAEKAIALDRDLDDGFRVRGWIRTYYKWDWAGAQADFERALALNPGHADNVLNYAHLHAAVGRLQEGVAAKKRATELDPLNPITWFGLAYMYRSTGQFDLARAATKRIQEVAPEWESAPCTLGLTSLLEGEPAAALASYGQCPNEVGRLWGTAIAHYDLGRVQASQEALDNLIAKYSQIHSEGSPYQIAQVYASRGDRKRAFDWLDRSFAERDGGMAILKYDLLMRKIRDDPRYSTLLRKVNLPPD
jgi:tetratricopeptide (TPR) repeat protein